MRLGVCCGLVALSGAATLPAYAAKPTDAQRPVPLRRTETVNHKSACDASHAAASSYGWPVKPFWRPHPVRGNFGDPRTSFFGALNQLTAGAFRFHNGIDISAPDGTAVYAVTSGRVLNVSADHLAAGSVGGHRHFQYWHILPVVRKGQRLTARRSVLGYVLPGQAHVHLTEFHRERVVNPLLPGHLYPYRDRRPPRVESLQFLTLDGQPLQASHLQGVVTVTATASDLPSLTPPGRWRDATVTPAVVRWSLSPRDGALPVASGTAFDVRHRLPRVRDFWHVYAQGTFQNFPVAAAKHLTLLGRYVFRLTQLDTAEFPVGEYTFTVEAADICGNTATLAAPIDIDRAGELPAGAAALPRKMIPEVQQQPAGRR